MSAVEAKWLPRHPDPPDQPDPTQTHQLVRDVGLDRPGQASGHTI